MEVLKQIKDLLFDVRRNWLLGCLLLFLELFLNVGIIWKVNYTEIDWTAYMQEVEGFLNGTWDYTELKGDTGPLVYPAGFVYIFSGLYYMTSHGANIKLAQYVFLVLYLLTVAAIVYIYHKSAKTPPYALVFLTCFSYRVHSIFVLRLFNDPVAMLLFYVSIIFFIHSKWTIGCVFYSLAVSVKMNILLSSPGLLFLLIEACGWVGTIKNLTLCALIQFLLAIPFLYENALGYITCAFNLGRQFFFKWTVNWRFLSEDIFLYRGFHMMLLILHIVVLAGFAFRKWKAKEVVQKAKWELSSHSIHTNRILILVFGSNFIGMCFARSLHYQFYVWYYHTLPFLLWSTALPDALKLLIWGVIELCWNTYPSTDVSSAALHVCHLVVLLALWKGKKKRQD
eukprot:m.75735 g.75735  ORF g.75735 m.75735 type:complete len:396 (+) comp35952_c0_seq10:18-1205(+)